MKSNVIRCVRGRNKTNRHTARQVKERQTRGISRIVEFAASNRVLKADAEAPSHA